MDVLGRASQRGMQTRFDLFKLYIKDSQLFTTTDEEISMCKCHYFKKLLNDLTVEGRVDQAYH